MTELTTRTRKLMLAIVALVAVTAFVAWFAVANDLGPLSSPEPGTRRAVPSYNRVGSVTVVSDLVVMGEVKGVVFTRPSPDGLSVGEIPGPTTFYAVEVKDVLWGDLYPGPTIVVGSASPGQFEDIPITTIEPGSHVVLFLQERTADDVTLATNSETFYFPVSFDNGVFDVTTLGVSGFAAPDETRIRARTLFMGGSSWTLRQLRKEVADSGGLTPEEHRRRIIVIE